MTRERPVLGIIGGGQLAQMLCQVAPSLELETRVFASASDESAASSANRFLRNLAPEALSQSLLGCDFITFENEFFSREIEDAVEAAHQKGIRVFPSLEALKTLRRKDFQKKLFIKLQIPTSAFIEKEDFESNAEFVARAQSGLGSYVLKLGSQGYDGKGVAFSSKPQDAQMLLEHARTKKIPIYAEKLCEFKKELAIIGARNQSGAFFFFPLVESVQKNGICDFTFLFEGEHKEELREKAQNIAKKVLESQNYVGVLGIEFFLDAEDRLLVNEVAPRVHNSGHYTQELKQASQFHVHLQAGLGVDFPSSEFRNIAMKNILGPESFNGKASAPDSLEGCYLHWYEKSQTKPKRKLGHLNFEYETQADLSLKFAQIEQLLKEWSQNLTKEAGNS